MHRLSPSQGTLYWAAIRSLLLLLVLAEIVCCSGRAIPNLCLNSRPKSSDAHCANTSRRFFFHVNKLRCKPFRLCEEDADIRDSQQGINYFQTMDECKQACSEVVQCPTMEPISNGALNNGTLNNGTSQGLNDTITYSCVEGYELVGSATRTCQLNGTWSGSEPYCQEQCRTPGPVEKAAVSPVQTHYSVGSIVTYTCDQGHVGGGQRVCQLNRTWTEDDIICQYVECPAVQAITNGVVTEHSRHYGSNVTYSCLAGFDLIGPSVRECLANGSWSGNEPHCQVMCPAPTPSDNAVVSPQSNYYSIGSKVQYTCSVGYVGSTERQCEPNGTWSGTQPVCEALQIECPDPIPITSGHVSAPKLSVGSKLMYFCDVNYTLIGNSTRVCTESGEWSGSKPVCARLRLLYGSAEQDVTNSTLSLPSGEEEHRISCITEPASYPGRIAPTWENKSYPHSVKAKGSQLVFESVFTSGEQKGEYSCMSGSQRATVNVTVVSSSSIDSHHKAPMLAVPPDTFCAPQGSDAMFQCVFTGCPIPDVAWYHNGTRIESDNKTKISSFPFQNIKVCSLAIERITTRDVGNYQCIGSNIKGNFSSQVVQLTMEHDTSKRSVQTDTRQVKSLHCRKDPKAVTVVGHMRRVIKKAAKDFTVYRLQVHKVLRSTEAILGERKRMTVVVPPTQNPTLRLQQDMTYIITGINIDNKLLFVDPNSIQTHSNELEDLIQTC